MKGISPLFIPGKKWGFTRHAPDPWIPDFHLAQPIPNEQRALVLSWSYAWINILQEVAILPGGLGPGYGAWEA